ncbi:MAG: flavodoxin family protein [Longibaculum sp.]
MISLAHQTISFCKGCLVCQKSQPCVIQDDANVIVEKMQKADVIVFSTPIYFYEMSGQMKTLIDRTNPLFIKDYQFRDIYLLATAADEDESAIDGAIKGLEGWIACFEKCQLKGVIKGVGVDQYGDKQSSRTFRKSLSNGKRLYEKNSFTLFSRFYFFKWMFKDISSNQTNTPYKGV